MIMAKDFYKSKFEKKKKKGNSNLPLFGGALAVLAYLLFRRKK